MRIEVTATFQRSLIHIIDELYTAVRQTSRTSPRSVCVLFIYRVKILEIQLIPQTRLAYRQANLFYRNKYRPFPV